MASDRPDIRRFFAPRAGAGPASTPSNGLASAAAPSPSAAAGRTYGKRPSCSGRPAASRAPAPAKRARAGAPTPTTVQTHLDLGQAAFHSTVCPECGMVYAPGNGADEALHRAHHAAATRAPRVVAGGASGVAVVDADAAGCTGRILHAPPGRRPAGVAAAVARAEAGLGTAPGWLDPSKGKTAHVLLFECAASKRVEGVVVVEGLARGGKVARWAGGREEGAPAPSPSAPLARPAAGVRAVYVAPAHRRRGVATALLDAARAVVAPLARVPRGALAFSAPTEEGACLAAAFTGERAFAVYGG